MGVRGRYKHESGDGSELTGRSKGDREGHSRSSVCVQERCTACTASWDSALAAYSDEVSVSVALFIEHTNVKIWA